MTLSQPYVWVWWSRTSEGDLVQLYLPASSPALWARTLSLSSRQRSASLAFALETSTWKTGFCPVVKVFSMVGACAKRLTLICKSEHITLLKLWWCGNQPWLSSWRHLALCPNCLSGYPICWPRCSAARGVETAMSLLSFRRNRTSVNSMVTWD